MEREGDKKIYRDGYGKGGREREEIKVKIKYEEETVAKVVEEKWV